VYCVALCLGLVGLQVAAEVQQVAAGFRPFARAPTRVPYSWDMFSIRIDRCAVSFDPALLVEGQRVTRWTDRTWPLEFDTIYNREQTYLGAAMRGCAYRTSPKTMLHLVCLTADGEIHENTFACP
jgi:hypothetical protein